MRLFSRVGIRTRIAGGSLLIAVLISVVAGIVLNLQMERIVRGGTIEVLRSDAASYVSELATDTQDAIDDVPGPGQLIAVVDPDGNLRVNSFPATLTDSLPEIILDEETHSFVGDYGHYLVRSTMVDVEGGPWHVVTARSAAAEDAVLGQMRGLLFTGLATIDLGVAGTALLLTSASLGPVNRLRRSAEGLTGSGTTELLPVGPADDEINRLAATLNDLITRLRDSTTREKQLVSDASHELRTPLAILRTRLELARTGSESVEQLRADIAAAERSAIRLSDLVTSMLTLSTVEAAHPAGIASGTELRDEVDDAVDRARLQARDTDVKVDYDVDAGSGMDEDFRLRPEDLGRVIDNLVGNALAAMGSAGRLTVSYRRVPGRLEITVADTGGGMSRDFEGRAFERFTRADSARDGAGLGLPIVAAVVARAGGEVRLLNSTGEGLTVVVTLPAVGPRRAR